MILNMDTQQEFWTWFIEHEAHLFALDPCGAGNSEVIFEQVTSALQKVHPDLTFELGPKEATREFVISAGGIKAAFPAVVSLIGKAPNLERWRFVAFRPRRHSLDIVEFRGRRVDPAKVQFSLLDNGKIAGLYLFIPGFKEHDVALKQIAYLLLDSALGEYDMETQVGLIEMFAPEIETDLPRHNFLDLPNLFDGLMARLEMRSSKPS